VIETSVERLRKYGVEWKRVEVKRATKRVEVKRATKRVEVKRATKTTIRIICLQNQKLLDCSK
jgi:hypothetical protein